MDNENVVYTDNGILSRKKEEITAICHYIDEPGGHDANWNKPIPGGEKKNNTCDSTYMKYLK